MSETRSNQYLIQSILYVSIDFLVVKKLKNDLKLHIKKLQIRAIFSLVFILLALISIGFGMLLLFLRSFTSIIFFVLGSISITYLIIISRSAKREEKNSVYEPVKFICKQALSWEELVCIFESITNNEEQITNSFDVRFYRLTKIFKLRTILYRTEDFCKKDFDNAKDRINRKANRQLNISPWVNRFYAGNMMRMNIIHTDKLNDSLYGLLSYNATHNLTRVEGIINIAVIGDQIIIPPIYGECDLAEIIRYKDTIKFVDQVLLN